MVRADNTGITPPPTPPSVLRTAGGGLSSPVVPGGGLPSISLRHRLSEGPPSPALVFSSELYLSCDPTLLAGVAGRPRVAAREFGRLS